MSKSSVPAPRLDSSAHSASGIRPKSLRLHDSNLLGATIAPRAPALLSVRNESRDSAGKIATLLLRRSRDELDLTQDETAALVDKHPTIIGRRERGQVDLGPLRDWAAMLREIVRAKGPAAANAFLVAFVEALAERDSK